MSIAPMAQERQANVPGSSGVGMDPGFFEDLSQICLKSVAAGKLPTYRIVAQKLAAKHGQERFDAVKEEVSTWMRNFCAVSAQSGSSEHVISSETDGKSARKMAYATVMIKPLFHKAHAHKLCIRSDMTNTVPWGCDVCFGKQLPDALRWRCSKQCDWDCCNLCMSKYRGRKKTIKLRHRKADPLGIIFSQLEVVGCYSGSVAEACREILPGDFLIQFDGHEVPNFGRLTELVKAKSSVKMGGHDPNALIVTELVFAEPFPHRDRSLQVMQETDDDPIRSQTTEALEVEVRVMRKSMEAFGNAPSDAERGLIAIMQSKVAFIEAEIRRRAGPADPTAPSAEAIAKARDAIAVVSPRDLLSPLLDRDNRDPEEAAVSGSEGRASATPVDHTEMAKERFANYSALTDKLNNVLNDSTKALEGMAEASRPRRPSNSPFNHLRKSSTSSPTDLISPVRDTFAKPSQLGGASGGPMSGATATEPGSEAAAPSVGAALADTAPRRHSDPPPRALPTNAPAQQLAGGPTVPASNVKDETAATAGAEVGGGVSVETNTEPAPPQDNASAAKIAELTQQLAKVQKSEAGAFRMLTKTNAKLDEAQNGLKAAQAANATLQNQLAEAHNQARDAAKAAAATEAQLRQRIEELLKANAELTAAGQTAAN